MSDEIHLLEISRTDRVFPRSEVFGMTKKEKCQELMGSLFGPASAKLVANMSEEDCVRKCREKVAAFFGEEKAREFDSITG